MLRTKKSFYEGLILGVLLLFVFSLPCQAAVQSGRCGNKMTYSFDTDIAKLTISGAGELNDDFTFNDTIRQNTKTVVFSNYSSTTIPSFSGFTDLETIEVPAGVTALQPIDEFADCKSLKTVTLPSSLEGIANDAFRDCSMLPAITIPSSVKTIGMRAFEGCLSLESITVPEGVTVLEQDVFHDCIALKTVKLPSTLVKIKNNVFYGCNGLKSLEIPYGTAEITGNNFHYCAALETIIIPNTVTTIDNNNFEYCDLVTIVGEKGSYAETYAMNSSIPFTEHTHEGTMISRFTGDEVCAACGHIMKRTVKDATVVTADEKYYYTGKAKCPAVTVTLDGKTLVNGTDYEVIYSNNINVGTGTITIKGKGAYVGEKILSFEISKYSVKGPKLSKLTPGKKKMTLTWKKQKDVKGYELQYSLDKKFKKNTKSVVVKKAGTTKKVIKKLKSGKKYYFRMRTYIVVDGVKLYSAWGKTSNKKIK